MDKPKILVLTAAYHPFIGGAEIAIGEIVKRLKDRFDFYIVTSRFRRDLPKREVRPEGTVIRIGLGAKFDKWFLPFSAFSPDLRSAQIFWGVDVGVGSLAAAIFKLFRPKTPFIFNIQYGYGEERLRRGRFGLIGLAFRFILSRSDYVTAISTYLLDLARRSNYCGPAEVIHNGVDLQKFKSQNTKGKITSQNSKVIITVSRLVEKNGIDILIRAVVEVKKAIPDVRCLIIGDGPERKALELQAASCKLQANVAFIGEILHEEIPKYLREADVFVRPSRSEGMGNAFVEALAAGVPVIGTPVGGIPDIIEDRKTGLFARVDDPQDLAKKIIRILHDPELAERIALGGRQIVSRQFSWDKIAEAYRRIFVPSLAWNKRVVVATGLYPPEIGGPATYSKLLVDELPQRGIGVRVVPFRSVRSLPRILRHAAYFWRVLRASRGADIIFAQDPVSVGLPALVASRILGKKFILKIVGDYAWEQFQIKNEKRKIKNENAKLKTVEEFQEKRYDALTEMRRLVQKFVARHASRVIVPSEYLKRIVTHWGVPEEKIAVIYNAFMRPSTPEMKTEARLGLHMSQDTFMIVSAGRLVPWKGFGGLIEAMHRLRPEVPSARLFIIGSGPEENKFKRMASGMQSADAVTFTGSVPHEVLLRYLRAGDLFILNSSYEGFSHTLLEAMAMGIPVAARAIGGNPEVMESGKAGVLYEGDDSDTVSRVIRNLYENPRLSAQYAAAGQAAAGRFTKEIMIEKTAGVLLSI